MNRRQTEDVLLEFDATRRRKRIMLDALHDGLVLHAADGRITEWNAAAERLLGLTAGQLVGRTSIDPVWRLVSGALAVFRDVTAEVDMERRDVAISQRLVTAIESGGVGTALLDEQARVTFANAALAGILEVSREELLGCSLRRFVQRTDPVDALLDDMERGRSSLLAQDVCIATGHGEVRWSAGTSPRWPRSTANALRCCRPRTSPSVVGWPMNWPGPTRSRGSASTHSTKV